MSKSKWRNFVCLPMILILPVSLLADDNAAALLRGDNGVLLNNNPAPPTSALFRDDLIETQKGAVARIEASGSTADLSPETVVQFADDELALDHGTVSVNTSRELKVRVGCITVTPISADWTHYEVRDVDGKVTVSALKSDVYLDSRSANQRQVKLSRQSEREIVRESEQKSRDEKCGAAEIRESTPRPGIGPILNSRLAWVLGVGGVGAVVCLGLCHDDDPLSPSGP